MPEAWLAHPDSVAIKGRNSGLRISVGGERRPNAAGCGEEGSKRASVGRSAVMAQRYWLERMADSSGYAFKTNRPMSLSLSYPSSPSRPYYRCIALVRLLASVSPSTNSNEHICLVVFTTAPCFEEHQRYDTGEETTCARPTTEQHPRDHRSTIPFLILRDRVASNA